MKNRVSPVPPSESTAKVHHLLKKQLNAKALHPRFNLKDDFYPSKTQYNNCSIGMVNQEESGGSGRYQKVISPGRGWKEGEKKYYEPVHGGCLTTERSERTRQLMETTIHHHEKKGKMSRFKTPLLKTQSYSKNTPYTTQVKEIIGYLVDKLLGNRKVSNSGESLYEKVSFMSETEIDLIKNQQEQLLAAKNKTGILIQQLDNVKQLWERANTLKGQLIHFEGELKKQKLGRGTHNTPHKYPSISRERIKSSPLDPNDMFGQIKDLLCKAQKEQSDKKSYQISLFSSKICEQLVELKERIERVEENSGVGNTIDTGVGKEMESRARELEERNKELERDNIRVLEENEAVHQKLHDTQLFYQDRVGELQADIKELRLNKERGEVEGHQVEVQSLEGEISPSSGDSRAITHEMSLMQNTIDILRGEKEQYLSLIEEMEEREVETKRANQEAMWGMRQKIMELEKEFEKIEAGHKMNEHTTMNPSQEESKMEQTESLMSIPENSEAISQLRRANEQLESELDQYKTLLAQKQESTFFQSQILQPTQVKSESEMAIALIKQVTLHLDTYSNYSPTQKHNLLDYIYKAISSKSQELPELASKNSVSAGRSEYPSEQINLSCRSSDDNLEGSDNNQPTYMDVFSKFDGRQESIFRLIDVIGSNLKSGDLLTEFVHQFLMKVIPDKDLEQFQGIAQDFILKVKQYQQQRIVTLDKTLSQYIMNTQSIFKQKEQIQAVLDQSSSDEQNEEKYLWEDILNPTDPKEKQELVKVVNRKARVALNRIMTINRKYSDKSRKEEMLEIIPEESPKERKNRSVLFKEEELGVLKENSVVRTPVKRRTRDD